MGIENRSQMTSHCNGVTRKPRSLSLSERDRELELWSKTLFYKNCSLGSVKIPSNS